MLIAFLFRLVRLLYRFRPYGIAALKTPGPVLLLPNHVSWWDWLLIGVCLNEDWRFVTSSASAETSWIHKRVMVNRRTFPVDMNSPFAVKRMAEYLQQGGRLVLFPEGRLSRTGALMKLFDGTGFLVFKTQAKVITAYIRGATRLPWSPNPLRKRWFPRLSVHFSPVLAPPDLPHASTTEARNRLTSWLLDCMIRHQFETEMAFGPATVPAAILHSARIRGRQISVQDASMQTLTYRRLTLGARLMADRLNRLLGRDETRVGVLLPNVNAMPVTLLSLWLAGKVPAILNFSIGTPMMLACARLAGLKHIVSSRAFLERARLEAEPFTAAGIEMVYLEDVRASISKTHKLAKALATLRDSSATHLRAKPDDTAVVLFTSGSEGDPKGVELTHRNLLANVRQMLSVVDMMETDRFFNALPLFHSFGLTVGLLLPLIHRVFVFLYPSPLHYRVVPSAFYNLDCTVFFGTNSFLAGYARKANPSDFRSVRYLFAGAEKLQDSTVSVWAQKFGVRILEGYGATECSPCLTVNTPARHRPGSAGQFLPGIEYRLEPIEGAGGRLFVRGPNIMRGYLNPEPNARFQALNGWYDTGDIVDVDADGYLHVLGRMKRFAKISGEMVSLTAVEDALASSFPQYGLRFAAAVVSKPDGVKGERLVAVTNESRLTLTEVRDAVRARGLGNLAVPREIKVLREIPRLGTGKVNHRELERLV